MQLFVGISILAIIIAVMLVEKIYSPRLDLVYSYNKRVLLIWYNKKDIRIYKTLYEW